MGTFESIEAADQFEGAEFSGLDLRQTPLSGKAFRGCTFTHVVLQDSLLCGVKFSDCSFVDSDLANVRPKGMKAQGVKFIRCKLVGVEWTELGDFPQIEFEECQLRYSAFVAIDLKKTPFIKCQAAETSFVRVDLTETDFSGTDLTGARFEECQLRKADFRDANGAFLDPRINRVKDTAVSVETAALMAIALGFRVAGYETSRGTQRSTRKSGR